MKIPLIKMSLIALPLVAASVLSSCVSDGYSDGGGGYVTYATLPPNYSGNAYYHNNRYYGGGRHESGHYNYGGRAYTTRYFYNGQYLYGGNYRVHSSPVSPQPRSSRSGGSSPYVTYTTLPPNYSGNAYQYGNRYYAGGRYETGAYNHGGQNYRTRYYHNGQYLYGGDYRQHSGPGSDRGRGRSRSSY